MTLWAFYTLGVSHTLALTLNPTRTIFNTNGCAARCKQGGLYGMAITRFASFHNPEKPQYSGICHFQKHAYLFYGFASFHKHSIYSTVLLRFTNIKD